MSFFGFDTKLPRDRPKQSLGEEYGEFRDDLEDYLGLEGDPEEVQEFFQHEDEADAANLDTFGDDAFIEVEKQEIPQDFKEDYSKEFDFVAANKRFEQVQKPQFPDSVVQAPRQEMKSIWEQPSPAVKQEAPRKVVSAAELEAQLLAQSSHGMSQGMPQGMPPFGMPGMPMSGMPQGMPPQGMPPRFPGFRPAMPLPPQFMMRPMMPGMQPPAGMPMMRPMPMLPPQALAQLAAASGRPLSAQELEALMRMAQQMPRPLVPEQSRPMNVEDLEREIMKKPTVPVGEDFGPTAAESAKMVKDAPVAPLPNSNVPRPPPSQVQKMSFGFGGGGSKNYQKREFNNPDEKQAWERRRRGERYNNVMTNGDRDLIARIQLSQLYMANPWDDDYYYQTYKRLKRDVAQPEVVPSKARQAFLNKNRNRRNVGASPVQVTQTMQRRVMEWIKERGGKTTKSGQFSKEGALGKISVTSTKNPRQQLQIKALEKNDDKDYHQATGPLSKYAILRRVEDVYRSILELEQRPFVGPPKAADQVRPLEGENPEDTAQRALLEHEQRLQEWEQKGDDTLVKLWEDLAVALPVPADQPHPFIQILATNKGKRALPRAMELFSNDQNLAVVTVLLSRFADLDVTQPGVSEEGVDTFMEHCFAPMVEVMSDAPLRLVNAWLRMILEKVPVATVVKSRTGLAVVSVILNRVEILKTAGAGVNDTTEEDIASWNELYQFVFSSLQGRFAHIFRDHQDREAEFYVWHFLAAVAVNTPDDSHQHALVADLKDKLMETVRLPTDQLEITGVDQFLRVLGLEPQQLQ